MTKTKPKWDHNTSDYLKRLRVVTAKLIMRFPNFLLLPLPDIMNLERFFPASVFWIIICTTDEKEMCFVVKLVIRPLGQC